MNENKSFCEEQAGILCLGYVQYIMARKYIDLSERLLPISG